VRDLAGASSPNSDCCLRFLPECGRPKKETRVSWNTNGAKALLVWSREGYDERVVDGGLDL
jgi:hypothetical protein